MDHTSHKLNNDKSQSCHSGSDNNHKSHVGHGMDHGSAGSYLKRFLDCNVIVYEKDEKVFASGILPTIAMSMVENSDLEEISEEVEEKMKRVINNL